MDETQDLKYKGEEESKKEKTKEKPDYNKWRTASFDEVQKEFGILQGSVKEIAVPVNEEDETVIRLYIEEIGIDELLSIMENIMQYDKDGNFKPKLNLFYKTVWHRMVKKTEPPLNWAQIKYFNEKFLPVLMDYLPDPLKGLKSSTEDEAKN